MNAAICSGSFDPVTVGHIDIITRSSRLFNEVVVLVLVNPNKTPAFTLEERLEFIRRSVASLPNVRVDVFEGLLADYARKIGANTVVRGLRAITDFESEFQMALINKRLYPEMETVYLNTSAENMYLSSSIVKQIAMFGGDIAPFVPEEIFKDVKAKLIPERQAEQK
ncbi:MAG: pantetheine-phosphate adenylyltransferase [Oscillospiraceae bacterium]|jgi:pantetheine-phosphate adenylyltransferase|nr:pantetheine-phosphate adenylyltransferase [Oscillospiraceae bacterium]